MSTRSGKIYRMEIPSSSDPTVPVSSNSHVVTVPMEAMTGYLSKKTITQGLLDVALLTANVSQLKYVYSTGSNGPTAHPFYHLMMTLISLSIILQITTGLCLIFIGKTIQQSLFKTADLINNLVTIQVFLITVLNILISSFGIEESIIRTRKLDEWESEASQYLRNCSCIQSTRLFYTNKYRNCEI